MNELVLSSLPKTWILDLDGTILKHNGFLIDGFDSVLSKSRDFINALPKSDKIIIFTARSEKYRGATTDFLKKENIRFDEILFDIPTGERIIFNDTKPSGLKTAYAVNLKRDAGVEIKLVIDYSL